jgi:hypothetical protein
MKKLQRSFARWSTVLVLATTLGKASILFDSGNVLFAPTGAQFGRISRNGIASDWATLKAFPGVTGAPTVRAYELFTVNTGPFQYIQINLDDPAAALFDAAYVNAYTPVNSSPNYGLNVNYQGDPGLSQPLGDPSFFQIVAATNTNLLIPINEVNPGGGAGRTFRLIVEGFYDTEYSEVPEPTSLLLTGCGAAVVGALRWKKRSSDQQNLHPD